MKAVLPALARLRARLTGRPDTEHEQALVRLLNCALFGAYLFPQLEQTGFWHVYYAYFVVSVAIVAAVLLHPGVSPLRRMLGAVVDAVMVAFSLIYFGEKGAPLYLIYLWITLANGFRYGARYLLGTLAISVASFFAVLLLSEFWIEHRVLGIGLMIGLIAVSLYVRRLVTQLFDALSRAEAANQAKRRFVSVISHELRTPLNAIIGMADLLRDTALTREQADMLQTLRGSSRVMLGQVEEVLDFSKIESGKLTLEKADFDLHALVNSTCRIIAAQAAPKGLDFVVSIMPEVPPAVRGDPHYLRQILINLAGNAVKFTERGSVTVHVSMQGETDSRLRLKFSIRDTGIGIPPEAQARIFDSFTQADQSTTRRFGGTGLGTTIAKQLVELMGGRIGMESAVGLGTTFSFEIEFEKQSDRAGRAGTDELSGARVLLIGFPPAQLEPLERALAGWGAVPVAADSVENGVERLVAEISVARPYHSALVYSAGRADLELAQRFKRAAPDPAPPTVLVVPPEASVQRFDALSSGFTAILDLPFDKRRLFNVLHSVSAGDDVREGVVRIQDYARRAGAAKKLRVLAADDNPTNREVIGKILERGGHTVTVVSDGEEVLDCIEGERYDIVILDRNMPGLGGIEALQALRTMTRGRERIPVVILSADVTPVAKREALEAGADAFLPKPIDALRLLQEVQTLCIGAGSEPRRAEPAAVRQSAPTGESAPVVNKETLQHLGELGSSPAFVERLVEVFVADNAVLLGRIETALSARNYAEFRALLHATKGSSASMGTDRLTRLCDALGKLADSELRLRGQALLRSLSDEFSSAAAELEAYVRVKRNSAS
jgi:two-component system, sensor histidine kinase RpfC